MTKTEKSRVKLLEKVLKIFSGSGSLNFILIFSAIAVLAIDTMLLFFAAEDDELYMILPFHILLVTIFLGSVSFITTSLVGDAPVIYQNMNMVFGGSYRTGDFLSTLPFQAKDILCLRVKNFRKQLFAAVATTIIVQIVAVLAGNAGYTMFYGLGGLAVAALVLYELLMAVALFMKKLLPKKLIAIMATLLPIASFMVFSFVADDHDKSAELAAVIDKLGFLSEIPGVIILAMCGAAIGFLTEFVLGKKRNVSWNLR